jgi:HSP20 family protein
MNLLERKEQLRLILKQSDLINTINGGVVEPTVRIRKSEKEITIQIYAPSVEGKAFKVMLNHDQLTIFYLLTVEDLSLYNKGEFVSMPMYIRTFEIPGNIDINNIQAKQKEDEIIVILPLNDSKFQRPIDMRDL